MAVAQSTQGRFGVGDGTGDAVAPGVVVGSAVTSGAALVVGAGDEGVGDGSTGGSDGSAAVAVGLGSGVGSVTTTDGDGTHSGRGGAGASWVGAAPMLATPPRSVGGGGTSPAQTQPPQMAAGKPIMTMIPNITFGGMCTVNHRY